jgi:hypothetical protein
MPGGFAPVCTGYPQGYTRVFHKLSTKCGKHLFTAKRGGFFGIFHVFCTSNVENLKRRGKDKKMIDSPAAIFL